jgi:CDGSH-type Zn-finger protein
VSKERSVVKVSVTKGKKYSFCTCGLSLSLPYCDNQHRDYNLKNNANYKSLKIVSDTDGILELSSSLWKS